MGSCSLELRMLRRIPAKYKKPAVFDGDPAGLEPAYGEAARIEDPWHIKLKVRSAYCSMDEFKAWLQKEHPGAVLEPSWSMTGGYYGYDVKVTDHNGDKITVPYGTYQSLKTPHVDAKVFERRELCWSLDLDYRDAPWLEPLFPAYIDEAFLARLAKMRYEFARKSDPADRTDRISEAGWSGRVSPDILGFLADGLAESKSKRCALYACLVD